ncbi:hypothetical protein Sste5346_009007 [Sporothrix stenoceras]|uniref:Uncharacterized protein n=1 Tax=Sporothrix stenoceras TaxID=5173 RepID=A0ABR3YLS9_9PEZI
MALREQTALPPLDTPSLKGDHVKPTRKVSFKIPAPLSTKLKATPFIPGPRTPILPKHLARKPAAKPAVRRFACIRIRLAAKLGRLKNIKTFKMLPIRVKATPKTPKVKKTAENN